MKRDIQPLFTPTFCVIMATVTLGLGATAPEYVPPTVKPTIAPSLPPSMLFKGEAAGVVRVIIEVDERGNLVDWLPLATTHRDLPSNLGDVLADWDFKPALENGKPAGGVTYFEITIRAEGIVLNLDMQQAIQAGLNRMTRKPRFIATVAGPEDIDQPPALIHAVQPPIYANVPEDQRTGEAVFEFFIDTEGRVRIPLLCELSCHPLLALSAYESLREWRFSPPRQAGHPVILRVRQSFQFGIPSPSS